MSHRRPPPKAAVQLAHKVEQLERALAPLERRLKDHEAHCRDCSKVPYRPCAEALDLVEPWRIGLTAYQVSLAALDEALELIKQGVPAAR